MQSAKTWCAVRPPSEKHTEGISRKKIDMVDFKMFILILRVGCYILPINRRNDTQPIPPGWAFLYSPFTALRTHISVILLIRRYKSDLEEFGRVEFEMRPLQKDGGTQKRELRLLILPHEVLRFVKVCAQNCAAGTLENFRLLADLSSKMLRNEHR